MQKQMASFIGSKGTAVVVENAATMVPVAQLEMQPISDLREGSKSKKGKDKYSSGLEGFQEAVNGLSLGLGIVAGSGLELGTRPKLGDGTQLKKPERSK